MKDIFNPQFWKTRIEQATAVKTPHYSVYVVHESGWWKIYRAHEKIMREHLTGNVLDAGCGYGRMNGLVSNIANSYTGVDFSEDFITMARKNDPTATFVQGDLRNLKMFKDHQFDWAFCVSIKRMVIDNTGQEEWNKMEKELKRVAKKLLILEYEDPENYEIV